MTVGRGGGEVSTNTAVGFQSTNATATGGNNTGVGIYSNYAVTSGTANTGIGQGANASVTTGTNNTGIGAAALNNSTGSYNTAVGSAAMLTNNGGSNNTAVGYQAGYSNQTGAYSVFVGQGAGYSSNVSGTAANTYVGQTAGYYSTTATYNSFFGNGSGSAITTGSKNTILGGYTGNAAGLDIRTASNYVVLSDGDSNPLQSSAYNKSTALQGAIPNTGIGITFPATQSASSDANTLDDYEEGTFTPSISPSSGSITSQTGSGKYTKVGNQVTITCYVTITNAGTASGSMGLTGFPFSSVNAGSGRSFVALVREDAQTGFFYGCVGTTGGTGATFYTLSTNNAPPFTNNYSYNFSVSYLTT
jgi:hypothetical protein